MLVGGERARPGAVPTTGLPVCLQCGIAAGRSGVTICRRCGLPYGSAPRPTGRLATCPVCYRDTDDDGQLASLAAPGKRLDLLAHIAEHDRYPVGDDDWLESLREGGRVRVGRWTAPYDLVRRYLVTGVIEGGRTRSGRHDTLVMAMTQVARWGPDGVAAIGDRPEWAEARAAVAVALERYHRARL